MLQEERRKGTVACKKPAFECQPLTLKSAASDSLQWTRARAAPTPAEPGGTAWRWRHRGQDNVSRGWDNLRH